MKMFILITLLSTSLLVSASSPTWVGGWMIGGKKSVEEINKRTCVGNNRYRCVPVQSSD
jgi:hypothetical protein